MPIKLSIHYGVYLLKTRAMLFLSMALFSLQGLAASDELVGVYVGEQPGAYIQNQWSSTTAYMFSAYAVNSDYWVNADIKRYLGMYADSVYINAGLTYARTENYPAEIVYRAGGGWEFGSESGTVFGLGATVWWNEAWVQPIVRGGIYVAFRR